MPDTKQIEFGGRKTITEKEKFWWTCAFLVSWAVFCIYIN